MKLRVHRFLPFTRAEGPGNRACIWVQGCPIRCPGCFNVETWSEKGGYEIDVDEMVDRILQLKNIEGVTFLGGEPFEQAEALAELGKRLKDAGLSVMTFSGYIIEDIRTSTRNSWQNLLDVTDLLLDGPYVQELTDMSRPWVGSSNQRYHFLTSRYRHLEDELTSIPNRVEIHLRPDGQVMLNGLATSKTLSELIEGIALPKKHLNNNHQSISR